MPKQFPSRTACDKSLAYTLLPRSELIGLCKLNDLPSGDAHAQFEFARRLEENMPAQNDDAHACAIVIRLLHVSAAQQGHPYAHLNLGKYCINQLTTVQPAETTADDTHSILLACEAAYQLYQAAHRGLNSVHGDLRSFMSGLKTESPTLYDAARQLTLRMPVMRPQIDVRRIYNLPAYSFI